MSSSIPVWNLSEILGDYSLPKLKSYLDKVEKRAAKFQKAFEGKVAKLVKDPKALNKALLEYQKLSEELSKPITVASLSHSVDSTDPVLGQLLAYTQERTNQVYSLIAFFDNELSGHASKLNTLMENSTIKQFKNYLKKTVEGAKHRLSVREEQIFRDKGLSGSSAIVRLYDEDFARQRYEIKGKKLTQSETLSKLYDPNRSARKEAAESLSRGFDSQLDRVSLVYNTLILDHSINSRYFKFESPEASRHLSNEINQKAVDQLVSAVEKSNSVVARYYKKKAKILGIKQLLDFDRYASIPTGKSDKFSWSDARSLVLGSCASFSSEYERVNRLFFENDWIHAAPKPNKRSGAYCHPVTADGHPYVFMNFTGTANDVMTLAHELGHAAHFYLSRKQGFLNFDVPLTVCETASVFSEMLTFSTLRERTTDPKVLRSMLAQKIESIFATVHRQISLFRFERAVHQSRITEGEVSRGKISEIWLKTQTEMFAGSVKFSDGYKNWWGYISHFFHSPFYVYAYAFGELLTLALYKRYQKAPNKEAFAKLYIDMLSQGSSKSPIELMQPFGLDLNKAAIWQDGIEFIEDMVTEFEEL